MEGFTGSTYMMGVAGTGSEEPSSNKGETQENVLMVTSCGAWFLTMDIGYCQAVSLLL